MRIERLAPEDDTAVRACVDIAQAVAAADDPAGPPQSARVIRSRLTHPAEPEQVWFVPSPRDGGAAGMYRLWLPDLEERDRAGLSVEVHPAFRRQGIGLALLRHAARQAAENGRSVLGGEVHLGSAGEAFAIGRLGARPGLTDHRRVLELRSLRAGHVAALRDEAARAAAGYTLVSWEGRTPEEHLDGVAGVFGAMNDGPRDAGREARAWDAHRVRTRIDDRTERFGTRAYCLAAVHAASGEMAALTRVAVDPDIPEWASQLITAVTRPHRGHRLGLLVKAAMLIRLLDAEPAMTRMVTFNAAVNSHMIAINEALGYKLLDPQSRSCELSVADVLAAAGQN